MKSQGTGVISSKHVGIPQGGRQRSNELLWMVEVPCGQRIHTVGGRTDETTDARYRFAMQADLICRVTHKYCPVSRHCRHSITATSLRNLTLYSSISCCWISRQHRIHCRIRAGAILQLVARSRWMSAMREPLSAHSYLDARERQPRKMLLS